MGLLLFLVTVNTLHLKECVDPAVKCITAHPIYSIALLKRFAIEGLLRVVLPRHEINMTHIYT